MSKTAIIRRCVESDKSAFVRLNLEFMQEVMDSHPYWASLHRPSAEEMGRTFMEALSRPENIQIFVAEWNGEVAGYTNTWAAYSIWSGGMVLTVDDLYISGPSRKNGIGENMMKFLISYAKEHKYKRIQLHAEPDNPEAHRLYKKMNFQSEEMLFFMKQI